MLTHVLHQPVTRFPVRHPTGAPAAWAVGLALGLLCGSYGCGKVPAPQRDGLAMSMWLPEGASLTRDEAVEGGRVRVWKTARDVAAIDSHDEVDAQGADRLFRDKEMLMQGLFSLPPSPYPGALTNRQPCQEKFRPRLSRRDDIRGKLTAWETTSNDRFVLGGCTEETTTMKAAYALLFCRATRTFHEVRYFTPRQNPTRDPGAFIDALACTPPPAG